MVGSVTALGCNVGFCGLLRLMLCIESLTERDYVLVVCVSALTYFPFYPRIMCAPMVVSDPDSGPFLSLFSSCDEQTWVETSGASAVLLFFIFAHPIH